MSDVDDGQGVAEATDDEAVDLTDFPPDEPMGVGHWGETALEEHMGEPLEERLAAEVPDVDELPRREDEPAGVLVDEDEGLGPDLEKDLVAGEVPFDAEDVTPSAEESAVHIVDGLP